MIREIVHIDEELCDGCGLCIPSCHEGALRLVNGKARLVSDKFCDGLGACLGHCPRGAIRVERRDVAEFDQAAVAAHLAAPAGGAGADAHSTAREKTHPTAQTHAAPHAGGCPGSRMQQFDRPVAATGPAAPATTAPQSELTHWPVQLRLLPPTAPVLRGARLLIAADCVPVAYAEFQQQLLHGRAVLIGCPKFDDLPAYTEKLTEIIRLNALREIVVARMEVPCCAGILRAVVEAVQRAASDVPVKDVVISIQGKLLATRNVNVAGSDVAGAHGGGLNGPRPLPIQKES
jgi:NAD-dependent dihydropyrimidine dehydrogenase PreA subunit